MGNTFEDMDVVFEEKPSPELKADDEIEMRPFGGDDIEIKMVLCNFFLSGVVSWEANEYGVLLLGLEVVGKDFALVGILCLQRIGCCYC